MRSIAIIPARVGSKRIPGKNIRDFLGKTVISYSIEAALHSGLFDEVMVSTDDQTIADIAVINGAQVPFIRSGENSSDEAGTEDVVREVLLKYQELGKSFDFVCCIYPVNPFLTPEILQNSFSKIIDGNFNNVFPVIRFSSPIQRALIIKPGDRIGMREPQFLNSRSQELEPCFHDAGMFYLMKTIPFLNTGLLWDTNTGFIEVSELAAQDIDNESDWKLAELKFKMLLREND
jgi:pseudaminic acid cytidylyltransferase